jgi:multidrug efflux pump subunit AcrA (membrane-fusion protein)
VPEVAIGYDQQGSYVMVVDDKNVVAQRPVKLGPKVGDRRVLEEGLTGDESVITSGLLRAMPGRPVTPVKEGSPAPPAPSGLSPKGKPGTNGK